RYMFPKGTIYNSKKSGTHGEVYLHATLPVKLAYLLARGIGAGIIGFIIIAIIFTFGPLVREEVSFDLGTNKINLQVDETTKTKAQNISQVQQEAQNLGISSYFSLVIPKIGAKAN